MSDPGLRKFLGLAAEALDLFQSHLFAPGARRAGSPIRVCVLTPGAIPTTDIFLKTRLSQTGLPVTYVDTRITGPQAAGHIDEGTFVIVVRYLPSAWRGWLLAMKPKLAGLAYLMDDDMPAAYRDADLPFRYAFKTSFRYAKTARVLSAIASEIWVSTPYLQRRYAQVPTRLVPPLYIPRTTSLGVYGPTYFYHGTAAHDREIDWLVDVVRRVQAGHGGARFELFGGERVKARFREIPRVDVLRPVSWPDYLRYTSSVTHAVGLAPCFDSPFNRARTHNKFFDITRCGAVGVYSDIEPYRSAIPATAGLLCPDDPDVWAAAILSLLTDERLRARLYAAAQPLAGQQAADSNFRL